MNTVRDLPANFKLSHGSHKSFEDGMCAMEAVAYIAGEPHSDHPSCASPVLARHCIRLNDRWNDEERQLLLAVIPKLVGTRGDTARHINQMFVLVDASIREIVPIALEARGHTDLTAQLRGLAPITDRASAVAAKKVCGEVKTEAYKRSGAYDAAVGVGAAVAYAYGAAAGAASFAAAYAYDDAAADAYGAAAAAAAYAAYAAVAYAAARKSIVLASLAALERAIAVTA